MSLYPLGYTGGYSWDEIAPYISPLESSGNPTAYNPVSTSSGNASGLYGITSGTWAQYAPQVPGASAYTSAMDAPADVQYAVGQAIYNARGLQPWSTAQQAVANAQAAGVTPGSGGSNLALPSSSGSGSSSAASGGSGTSSGASSGFFEASFNAAVSLFERGAVMALGALLLAIGLYMLASGNRSAVKVVGKIADLAAV